MGEYKYLYYPGCTVKRDAAEYEEASLVLLRKIGIGVKELDRWYCCGSLFSLATDDLMSYMGGVRTLMEAQKLMERGDYQGLMTLCPMCYNVLRRINLSLRTDRSKLETIAAYMEGDGYRAGVRVVHLAQVLAENKDRLRRIAPYEAPSFKVAVYYGCMMLRPKEIAIDDPENPGLVEDLLRTANVATVNYPFKAECCGSFHLLLNRGIVEDRVRMIASSIVSRGADTVVMMCPLCLHNFREVLDSDPRTAGKIKLLYLSELLVRLASEI